MFTIHIHPKVWRFLGFMSCVVGFICYALSPSFHDLFGHWTLSKIVFYSILSTIFSILTLFINKCPQFSRVFLLKAHVGFLALMLTSLYSFVEDQSQQHDGGKRDQKGRPRNILSLVSFAAFAFMSVSLSKQIQPTFDVGISNFFLGCLIVAVMKLNIKIALAASALFYLLITISSCWDFNMGLPFLGDTDQLANTAQLNELQTLAAHDYGDEEQGGHHMEMSSLDKEGHQELDAVVEIQVGIDECDRIDELDKWFQALEGPISFSSPF